MRNKKKTPHNNRSEFHIGHSAMLSAKSRDCDPSNSLDGCGQGSRWLIETSHVRIEVYPGLTK